MSRVLISGFYGFDNAGDEAVLAAMLQMFRARRPELELSVLSAAPEATRRLHGVAAIPRMARRPVGAAIAVCDLFVSGGGSLLQDSTSARSAIYYLSLIYLAARARKPVALYCQGIGPLRRPALRRLTRLVLNRAALITVRDEESARELQRLGVGCRAGSLTDERDMGERGSQGRSGVQAFGRSGVQATDDERSTTHDQRGIPECPNARTPERLNAPLSLQSLTPPPLHPFSRSPLRPNRPPVYLAADPVFALIPASDFDPSRWFPEEPPGGWLGVSVRPWPGIEGMLPRLGASLRRIADQTGLRPLLLPLQWDMDHPVCEQLAAHVPDAATLARPGLDPRGWLALVGSLRALVAMRLHALIFAAARGIPLAGIAYDPKVDALLERLGEPPAATVAGFDPDRYADLVCSSLADVLRAEARGAAAARMAEAAARATDLTMGLLG